MRAAYWWIDRWRKSTAYTDLSLAEQGAYRNLLDELWLRGGVIPNDERVLGKIAGDALAWPGIRDRVMARFILTPDGWRNETHDEVAGSSDRYLASQAEKGRKRAEQATRSGGRFTSPPAESPADSQPGHQPRGPAAHQPPGPGPGPGLGQGPAEPRVVPEAGDQPVLIPEAETQTRKGPRPAKAIHPLGALWNAVAGDVGLPKVAAWTSARDRAAKGALAEEPDLGVWDRAFRAIGSSKFHKGGNDRGWKADFDFAIRPSSRGKWLDEARNATATDNLPPILTPDEQAADMRRRIELTNRVRNGTN